MKKYALYPGVGRVQASDPHEKYVEGRQLAACYGVPYSECLDMDNDAIKRVARMGAKFDQLLHLVPNALGIYRLPNAGENKIILSEGLHEMVKKDS